MLALSIFVGTDTYASEIKLCLAPPKINVNTLYFSPKVTYPESLYGIKIMKIERAIENLTIGHFLKKRAIEWNSDYENLAMCFVINPK
jgi:hypothetical protein